MADARTVSELKQVDLSHVPLLADVEPEARAALERIARVRRFHAHEHVLDQESASRDLCLVLRGRVRVVSHSASGKEISFDEIEAGGFFGELSALDGQPRSASIVALTEGEVALIAPQQFETAMLAHPRLALAVLRRLAAVVRRSTERIMELSTLGANNRVHAELLRLARAHSTDGREAMIAPAPNDSDMASRVSTTRETVNRVLNDLARQDIVHRSGRDLQVRNLPLLAEMVEDVRGY